MYKELINSILNSIGGTSNVVSATHCFTRLRFVLKDNSLADKQALEGLEHVMKVVEASGQLQIVIGNEVANVYKELLQIAPELKGSDAPTEVKAEKPSFKGVLNAIASIFTPTIPALAGAGVIKGILVLLTTYGLLAKDVGTYQILNAAADSIFYFMPIILGYTSAKIFGCNIPITMAIGGSLIYPSLVSFMADSEAAVTFLGIPVVNTTYSSTVIPIILAAFVYSKLEKLLDKVIPNMVKSVVAPLISLMIMVPATMLVFGPFGNYTSQMIGVFFQKITSVSPLIAGAFFGGVYSILVMFGMHRALVPIGINEVSTFGSTTLWAFTGPANFAQAGAAFGSFLRLKDKEMKSVALSASITALFGITEPALYGVNLKYKKPMIAVVISGAVGGAIAGVGGARAYAVAIPSVLTLPTFFGEGFTAFLIAIIVAFGLGIAITVMLGLDEGEAAPSASVAVEHDNGNEISSPLNGTVVSLSEVNDETFASGVLGTGCAVIPADGKLYAPVSGEISSVFDTNHALGITSATGVELLLHVGINTVALNGKHFKSCVKAGDKVKRGQLLLEFDRQAIEKAGFDTTTMVIVTEKEANELKIVASGKISAGSALISVQ